MGDDMPESVPVDIADAGLSAGGARSERHMTVGPQDVFCRRRRISADGGLELRRKWHALPE